MTIDFISIVMPAHNEGNVIGVALERLERTLNDADLDFEVLLIADGCEDDTVAKAEGAIKNLQIFDLPTNVGKGGALQFGVPRARADVIVLFDADLDIDPHSIVLLTRQLDSTGVDAVVASKLHRDSEVSYPLRRRVLSRVFRSMVALLFNLPISDTQTGLKVFRREAILTALPFAKSSGFAFDLELLVYAHERGFSVTEGPVRIDYKFQSSVRLSTALDAVRNVLSLKRQIVREKRLSGN